MKVSVLIITYQRTRLLEKCLKSLCSQKAHTYTIETHILINGNDPLSTQLTSGHPLNPLIEHSEERLSPAEARNVLIEKASGDYILFLDDDVELPLDYFKKSQAYTSHGILCFGGPDILPENPNSFQKILSTSQKLWMSSAHTRYRHGATVHPNKLKHSGEELILCNMWLKKEVLERYQLRFDGRFQRNEENILIHQLRQNNIDCVFAPELYVHHYKKDHLTAALKAIYSSAYHRALSFRYYPKSIRVIYFIPLFFVIFLVICPWTAPEFSVYVIAFYLFLGLIDVFINTFRKGCPPLTCLGAWGMQILTNITYGLGFLRGLLSFRR